MNACKDDFAERGHTEPYTEEPVITDGALEGLGDVMCCLGHLVVLYEVVQPRITRTLNNQAYMLCK